MSMWKRICSILLTGTLMTGCFAMSGCAPKGKALDGARLVTFGDSLTAGGTWPRSVAEECNMYLFNGAKGGITSKQALERFDKYVANRDPDFVTLSFGMNDLIMEAKNKPRVSLDDYKQNLKTLCEKVVALDATPILLTVSYLDSDIFWSSQAQKKSNYADVGTPLEWLDQYNAKVRELAEEEGYDLVDIRAACDEYPTSEFLKSDGIHLASKGNEVYTQLISSYLKEHFYSNPNASKIESTVEYAESPAEGGQMDILSYAPTDWDAENMEIEQTAERTLAIRNTNGQWPAAQYTPTKPLLVPMEGSELVYDFETTEGIKTSIILFFDNATPDTYSDGQYVAINSLLPNVKTEAGSGDILSNQKCSGSIPLSDLNIPKSALDENGNLIISGVKIFAAGWAGQNVVFNTFAVSTTGAPVKG